MSASRLLLLAAVIVFALAAVGATIGAHLLLVPLGLCLLAASFLVGP
jgi:hypothetical protein